MELNKKAAYLQGLVDGLGMDESTKEGKIIKAMAALLGEMADAIAAMDEDLTRAYDQINDLSEELEDLEAAVEEQLNLVHQGMYERAKKNLEDHIYEAHSLEEAKELQEKNGGFIKTMWCGSQECELKMKEVAGMSSRCIPFKQEHLGDTCACCGKPASKMIYWGIAY